jgi:hypothetical protein
MFLNIPIPEEVGNVITIASCLDSYFGYEKNEITCDACKMLVTRKDRRCMLSQPKVLVHIT